MRSGDEYNLERSKALATQMFEEEMPTINARERVLSNKIPNQKINENLKKNSWNIDYQ